MNFKNTYFTENFIKLPWMTAFSKKKIDLNGSFLIYSSLIGM